ncbi:MAG: hypothetical protein ABFD60_12405 [Bryobacteraceae bacterium]
MAKFKVDEGAQGPLAAPVEKLPDLACIGYPTEVTEPKITKDGTGDTFNIRVTLTPVSGTAGRKLTTNFMFLPDWFNPGFDPRSLRDLKKEGDANFGAKLLRTYAQNVYTQASRMTALEGLLGTQENFNAFWHAVAEEVRANGDFTAETVEAATEKAKVIASILRAHTVEAIPTVGYIARQAKDKVGVDENGKGVYDLRDQYEIADWFVVAPAEVKKLVARAAKAQNGSFKVTFDPEQV